VRDFTGEKLRDSTEKIMITHTGRESAQRGGERYSLDDKIVDRTLEVIGQRLVDGFYCTLLNDDFVRRVTYIAHVKSQVCPAALLGRFVIVEHLAMLHQRRRCYFVQL
jgi:hypothetical protein